MAFNAHKKGALVEIRGVFKDLAGTLVDPATVSLRVTKPDGTQATETYSPGNIVRLSLGTFKFDQNANQAGEWHYVWFSTGTGQAAQHGVFIVEGKA